MTVFDISLIFFFSYIDVKGHSENDVSRKELAQYIKKGGVVKNKMGENYHLPIISIY